MNVLIVTTAFPRRRDDFRAPFIFEAAQAIKRHGVSVKVLAMHSPGALVQENWDGIEIYRPRYLPEKLETLQRETGGLPVAWNKGGVSRLAIIPFIITHALGVVKHAREADIIHANWTLSAGCVWLMKWLHRRPYVVTVHGSDIFQAGKIPIFRGLTRVILRQAEKVIAVSKSLALEVAKLGVEQESIEVIPDGVDVDRFHPGENERDPVILFVGALTRIKGGDILLRAFCEVAETFPDYRLVMVGDGPCRSEWKALASNLGIADKVTFTGALGRDDVAEWMRRAKLFVLSSRSEGLGVVLLEALASGTPCIGSAVGGIMDILSSEVGDLFPSEDHQFLSMKIKQKLMSYDENLAMQAKLVELTIKIYSWKAIGEQIISFYHCCLRKND